MGISQNGGKHGWFKNGQSICKWMIRGYPFQQITINMYIYIYVLCVASLKKSKTRASVLERHSCWLMAKVVPIYLPQTLVKLLI